MIVIFLFMFIYITTLPYINATSATQAFFFQAYLRAISPALNVCLENGMHFVCEDYRYFDMYNKIFWCLIVTKNDSPTRALQYLFCFLAHPLRSGPWPLKARLTREERMKLRDIVSLRTLWSRFMGCF